MTAQAILEALGIGIAVMLLAWTLLLYVPLRWWPVGRYLWVPKLAAGAFSPFIAAAGLLLADEGGRTGFWWLAVPAGLAAVGLAGGSDLQVSLMPFLLRGVNLLGVNSAATRREKRLAVWQRIAGDLAPRHLDAIVTRTVSLAELPQAFKSLTAGSNTGRTLVAIHDER